MNKIFFKFNQVGKSDPMVVTRSSAVFYFRDTDNFKTELHFMNYWIEKRGTKGNLCKITLRNLNGSKICDEEFILSRQGAYVINIGDLLNKVSRHDKLSETHEGSVEIEIFSNENLFINNPAVLARYVGKTWHTNVHSSQRYFSENSGDSEEMINQPYVAEEGNFTIHSELELEPIFIIHNGKNELIDEQMIITVIAEDGRKLNVEMVSQKYSAYETKLFALKDYVDYRSFLKGSFGSMIIKYTSCGVFPRLVAGHENTKFFHWSIDHTNFADLDGPAMQDVFATNNEVGFNNLVFNLPNNSEEEWNCFVDLYPTYPFERYSIEVINRNRSGEALNNKSYILTQDTERPITRINTSHMSNAEFIIHNSRACPRRFHMGIHYQVKSGNYGFLVDGAMPQEYAGGRTRWSPVFDAEECDNYILISNTKLGNKVIDVAFFAKLFNAFGEQPLVASFNLGKYESKCIKLSDAFPGINKYLKGSAGWVYLTTDDRQYSTVHYVSIKNKNSVACCHAF